MRRLIGLVFVFLAGCASSSLAPSTTREPSVAEREGAAIAQRDCAACHALAPGGRSPNPTAPDFAAVRLRHNALSLERLLGEIAVNGHWEMPRRPLSSADIQSLVAYIEAAPPRP